MRRIYIVRKNNYRYDPVLAFESEEDSIEVAESIHGDVADIEEYVVSVPLVGSDATTCRAEG